jgi:hypothetical protein
LPPKGNNKASTPDTKENAPDTAGATPANNAQAPADAKKSDAKGKRKAGPVADFSKGVEGVEIGKE